MNDITELCLHGYLFCSSSPCVMCEVSLEEMLTVSAKACQKKDVLTAGMCPGDLPLGIRV